MPLDHPYIGPKLTDVQNRPASECCFEKGNAYFIGPTAVDFSMLTTFERAGSPGRAAPNEAALLKRWKSQGSPGWAR